MKRICSFLTVLAMIVTILVPFPITATAETATSGTTGDCTWTLDGTTLTISGNGAMGNHSPIKKPWGNAITKVIIQDGVTSIGNDAFSECSKLTSVTIPDSVTLIGRSAFSSCIGLTSITIGRGVTSINSGAFDDCTGLTSITIPDSVTVFNKSTFNSTAYYNDSKNWKDGVLYIGNHLIEAKTSISGSYTVKEGTATIATSAFKDCTGLTSVTIPDSVTSIGQGAFYGCTGLTSITLPFVGNRLDGYGLTNFGYIFGGTSYEHDRYVPSSLKSVIITKATSIGANAFKDCTGLTEVVLPENLATLGDSAFNGCTALSDIAIPDTVTYVGTNPLNNTAYYYDSENWEEGAFYLGKHLLEVRPSVSGSYTVKDGTLTIADAFRGCTKLNLVTIPDTVVSIGSYAFYNCSGLTAITLPDSVTTIGEYAFFGCTSLKSIVIPDGVTTIKNLTFYGCTGLTSISLPASITTIEMNAFSDNYHLQTVHYGGSKEAKAKIAIGTGNKDLLLAQWHYNSTAMLVEIISHPTDVLVANGATAKVTVEAEGDGLTYNWYFKEKGNTEFTLTPSFKGPTYAVAMNYARSGRQVYCLVTDQYGNSVKSSVATIKMIGIVELTKQPVSVSVANGGTAKVSLTATGHGLTYKWYFKEKNSSTFYLTNSFKSNSYSVLMNNTRAGRQVYCVVTDKYGNSIKSNTVTLHMTGVVKLTKQPASVSVAHGSNAKISLNATGHGLTYQWYFKERNSSTFYLTSSFKGKTYSVQMNNARAGRQVYCIITDKYGNKIQTKTVTLGMTGMATITKQPKTVTVASGAIAKASVIATGHGLTYKWYFKDANSTKFHLTTSFTGKNYAVTMNAARAGRQIYCVITDKYGNSVKTNTVTLKMK